MLEQTLELACSIVKPLGFLLDQFINFVHFCVCQMIVLFIACFISFHYFNSHLETMAECINGCFSASDASFSMDLGLVYGSILVLDLNSSAKCLTSAASKALPAQLLRSKVQAFMVSFPLLNEAAET